MLILPEPFFVSSSSLHAVTLLSASMLATEGEVTPASDEFFDESSKRKRTLLSSNSRRSLYD
jgi:hypothetical protein